MTFLVNSNRTLSELTEDLKNTMGVDNFEKFEQSLVDSFTKSIDDDILEKLQQMGLDYDSLCERKINAKRRIILMQIFDEPPEFFKK